MPVSFAKYCHKNQLSLSELTLNELGAEYNHLKNYLSDLKDFLLANPQINSIEASGANNFISLLEDAGVCDLVNTLAQVPTIKTLILSYQKLGNDGAKAVAKVSSLEMLALPRNNIEDAGLVHFAKLKNLKSLVISHNKIKGGGLKALRKLENLEIINLSSNAIDNSGAEALEFCSNLRRIYIDKNEITDEGIASLCKLPNLNILAIKDNPISEMAYEEISNYPALLELHLDKSLLSGESKRKLASAYLRWANDLYNKKHSSDTEKAYTAYLEATRLDSNLKEAHLKMALILESRAESLNQQPMPELKEEYYKYIALSPELNVLFEDKSYESFINNLLDEGKLKIKDLAKFKWWQYCALADSRIQQKINENVLQIKDIKTNHFQLLTAQELEAIFTEAKRKYETETKTIFKTWKLFSKKSKIEARIPDDITEENLQSKLLSLLEDEGKVNSSSLKGLILSRLPLSYFPKEMIISGEIKKEDNLLKFSSESVLQKASEEAKKFIKKELERPVRVGMDLGSSSR